MFKKILPLLAFAFLVLIWELVSNQWGNQKLVLPSPSSILGRIIQTPDRFLFHTKVTFFEMIGGFLLAFLIAFPLAWMMDQWGSVRDVLQPLFVIVQCIPMFALAPIMVIWFGWSYVAIVVPTMLMIFFPLTMNIYQGLRSTPDYLKEYFKVHQATQMQLLFKLQLPWAKSHIFAGFRIAAAIAGIGAVAGEWAGAQSGLGLLMIESRRATDLETTFGALFCLASMSLTLYGIISILEKKVFTRRMHARITSSLS